MRLRATIFIPLIMLLGGCATAPSINVFGAYFPDWLFCFVGAIAATMLTHSLLFRTKFLPKNRSLTTPLAYFALTITIALIGWLIFFKN